MYHQSIGSSFGCDRSGAIIVNWPGAIHLLAQIVLRVAVANWSGAIHLPAWWDSTSVIPVWRRSPPIVACVHASPVVKVFADTNALGQARCTLPETALVKCMSTLRYGDAALLLGA